MDGLTQTIAGLTGFELPNLHSSWRGQDISRLPHKPSCIDLCTGRNDLGLSNPLLLRSRREGRGHLSAEDDILDEKPLNGNPPFVCNVGYNFGNFERDGFALGHDTLDGACADNVAEGGLGAFDECLVKVGDTEGCTVWVADLVVDDGVTTQKSKLMKDNLGSVVYIHFNVDIVTSAKLILVK